LRWFTIVLSDAATLDGVRERLAQAGALADPIEEGLETRDPFGNRIRIMVKR
jgi:catechol 2,3-dioxygenase